ncbi:MAG: alternative ribosome rescue aminoacyl-tRNA hydrolase ArfB [Bacteroidetes bacterium]|nr:alternative ribosome rescue aminoacyl-tRNA hydrolase ArfB [Bacteroidota bacterium]
MNSFSLAGRDFTPELVFSASRSSGPGGQNVNKVSTKMELRFHIMNSFLLSETEKILLMEKLGSRINKEGELVMVSQSERTQLKNKEAVIEKFYALISKALKPRKKRKPTRPTAAAREKRLESKRMNAQKKEQRLKPNP